jgi:hypothetical protein
MDHEAMRDAYLRALNYNVEDFKLHQCNSCGVENDSLGDYIIVQGKIRIWNCDRCLNEQEKEKY